MMKSGRSTIFVIALFLSCSAARENQIHRKSAKSIQALSHAFASIETLDDLKAEKNHLKKEFMMLSEIITKAKQENISEFELDESAKLKSELERLYAIEGMRELIEECQREALRSLK